MKQQQEIPCPECGARMALRSGKRGQFYGCSTYPTCTGTRKHPYIPDPTPVTGAAEKATRKKLQESFDKFCNSRGFSPTARDRFIKDNLGIENTNIASFDNHSCQLLAAYMKVEDKIDPAPPAGPTEIELAMKRAREKRTKR